jgi:hypothetical protein
MMFDEVQREFSFGSWFLQFFLAFCSPVVVLAVLESRLNIQDTLQSQVLGYLFLAATAVAMALLISAITKESASEGSWVWMIPSALEVPAVIWQALSGGIMSAVHGFFFVAGPGQGEESWGLLLTLPTWSCCWYSAAMWWRLRRRRDRETRGHS